MQALLKPALALVGSLASGSGSGLLNITADLDRFGVTAVFLFILVENLGAPIPGETMLLIASGYAATGHINVVLVALCAIGAMWIGSTLTFLAGRTGGVALMRRLHVPEHHLERAQTYVARWGGYTCLFGRFVPFLRSYIGWLAGLNRMAPASFLVWNLIGAVVWTLTFTTLGFVVGDNLGLIVHVVTSGPLGAVLGVVVLVAVVIGVRYVHGREKQVLESPPGPAAPETSPPAVDDSRPVDTGRRGDVRAGMSSAQGAGRDGVAEGSSDATTVRPIGVATAKARD